MTTVDPDVTILAANLLAALRNWANDYEAWGDEFESGVFENGGFTLHDHSYTHNAKSYRLLRAVADLSQPGEREDDA